MEVQVLSWALDHNVFRTFYKPATPLSPVRNLNENEKRGATAPGSRNSATLSVNQTTDTGVSAFLIPLRAESGWADIDV